MSSLIGEAEDDGEKKANVVYVFISAASSADNDDDICYFHYV